MDPQRIKHEGAAERQAIHAESPAQQDLPSPAGTAGSKVSGRLDTREHFCLFIGVRVILQTH